MGLSGAYLWQSTQQLSEPSLGGERGGVGREGGREGGGEGGGGGGCETRKRRNRNLPSD